MDRNWKKKAFPGDASTRGLQKQPCLKLAITFPVKIKEAEIV